MPPRNLLSWSLLLVYVHRHKLSCPEGAKAFTSNHMKTKGIVLYVFCLFFCLYFTSPSPRDNCLGVSLLHHSHSCPHLFSCLLFLLKHTYSNKKNIGRRRGKRKALFENNNQQQHPTLKLRGRIAHLLQSHTIGRSSWEGRTELTLLGFLH